MTLDADLRPVGDLRVERVVRAGEPLAQTILKFSVSPCGDAGAAVTAAGARDVQVMTPFSSVQPCEVRSAFAAVRLNGYGFATGPLM